jgi:SAM-dependent methyltransferase
MHLAALENRNQVDQIRRHYGPWARTYGQPSDDGLFALVRARENQIIRSLLRLRGDESILDAGCGTGEMARSLKQRGHEVWAVDCTPEMIARVDGAVDRALVADLNLLDLGRRFDLILCIGALEFSPAPQALLHRMRRHLRPGGRLILLVPRTGPAGWIHRMLKRRHRLSSTLFSPRGLRRMGEAAGLAWRGHRIPFFHNFVAELQACPRRAT